MVSAGCVPVATGLGCAGSCSRFGSSCCQVDFAPQQPASAGTLLPGTDIAERFDSREGRSREPGAHCWLALRVRGTRATQVGGSFERHRFTTYNCVSDFAACLQIGHRLEGSCGRVGHWVWVAACVPSPVAHGHERNP